jgi:hypothetical protein
MKTKFYFLSFALVVFLFSGLRLSAQTPTITLLQPTDPGIEWTVGGTYVISWVDNFPHGVDILLTADNGASFDTIATNVLGSVYYWTTTGVNLGTNYKIKVESTLANSYYDMSSHTFSLVDQTNGYITMEQPVGGEVWSENNTYLISWNDNLTEPVKVELFQGGASAVATLSSSTTGSTLSWTIPTGYAGTGYTIKVSSTVTGATTTPAESGAFDIIASSGTYVDVYKPAGGEHWAKGTTHLISWNDDVFEPVYIQLYDVSAGTYTTLDTNVVGTTWYWTIDNALTAGSYSIYVRSTLDPTHVYDYSGNFNVTTSTGTYIEVYQPAGGESWARGTSHLISWNDDVFEKVYIQLYDVSAGTYTTLDTNVVGTTWVWSIDNALATGSYKIYVRSTLDPTHVYDNGGNFSITASTGTYIEVYQPNGGESWARGTSHLISWNDDFPEGVNLVLKHGSTIIDTIGLDILGSTYVWNIPTSINPDYYKVEIYSTLDSLNLNDDSDGNFNITASAGTFVEVLQPNGGEVWAAGTSYWISWNDDFVEGVNIELFKNGSWDSNIATNVLGSAYSWTIPVTQSPSTHYKVEVYSTLDSTNLHDFSDNYFEIVPQTMMSVYPNPANNQVTVNMENMRSDNGYTLQVFNRFNKPVMELQTNSPTTTLSTTRLSDGIYFVVATSDKNRVTKKMIIQH